MDWQDWEGPLTTARSFSSLWLGLLVAWIFAFAYSDHLGQKRCLKHQWLWGFFLGWIGVVIVALRPSRCAEGAESAEGAPQGQ